MKIMTLSTSRADYSALQEAGKALMEAGYEVMVKGLRVISPRSELVERVLDQLQTHRPDLVVLHGDRWDAMLAATAAVCARVPIAHIGGGDVTTGSYDNRFRDAISMLADYHLTGSAAASTRLSVKCVAGPIYTIGELAIDWLMRVRLPTYAEVCGRMLLDPAPYILINWQPETAASKPNEGLQSIVQALKFVGDDYRYVFMSLGHDTGWEEADQRIRSASDFLGAERVRYMDGGLTREMYAAAMQHCHCMVGNSSSGLIEAPVFSRPFVMVGDRQTGRMLAPNLVSHVRSTIDALSLAEVIEVQARIGGDNPNTPTVRDNPYGDGTAGMKLVRAVREIGML